MIEASIKKSSVFCRINDFVLTGTCIEHRGNKIKVVSGDVSNVITLSIELEKYLNGCHVIVYGELISNHLIARTINAYDQRGREIVLVNRKSKQQ